MFKERHSSGNSEEACSICSAILMGGDGAVNETWAGRGPVGGAVSVVSGG